MFFYKLQGVCAKIAGQEDRQVKRELSRKIARGTVDYNSNNSKNFNRNMFAYHKMVNALMASAKRNGIEVYEVDAMYTSLIGKEKYQPYYNILLKDGKAFAYIKVNLRALPNSELHRQRY